MMSSNLRPLVECTDKRYRFTESKLLPFNRIIIISSLNEIVTMPEIQQKNENSNDM